MILSHDSPDCTGRWAARAKGGKLYWRCDGCGAVGYDTTNNHDAAIQENLLGNTLDQLTKEGRRLLDR